MPTNIPAGQSRIVCWLGEDLSLPSSSFNTASHTFSALSEVNGASQSWRAGRTLNSLPSSTLRKLSTYRVQAGSAALTLPDHATGNGGAIDLTRVANIPVADFTFTVSGGTVSFSPTGSTPGSGTLVLGYDWDFGDGSAIDFGNAPQHAYTAVGTYTVRLRVMNDMNTRSLWRSKTVTVTSVSPAPTPVPPGPSPTPPTPPSGTVGNRLAIPVGTYRRFWIGNSVTDVLGDAQATSGMDAIAATQGFTDQWARHMIPGASPKWIWDNSGAGFNTSPYGYYPNAMANYGWDFCHIQPFDLSHVDEIDYFQRYMNLLITMSGSNLQPVLYQRWPRKRENGQPNDGAYYKQKWDSAYVNNSFDYEKRAFFETVCNALRQQETRFKPVIIAPVGEVFYQLNEKMMAGQVAGFSDIFQVYSDGIHMGVITLNGTNYGNPGSYIAAATFYSALYYRRLQNNTIPAGYGSIPNYLRDIINDTVWEVVTSYSLTNTLPQSDNTKPIVSIQASQTETTVGVNIDFSAYANTLGNGSSLQGYNWQITRASDNSVVTSFTSSTPSYTFTQAGKYKVSLQASNNNGVNSSEVYIYVLVS